MGYAQVCGILSQAFCTGSLQMKGAVMYALDHTIRIVFMLHSSV